MKKVNFGKMFMAFAMMLAVGMFAACSSSDDNNNNKDTSGGGETPTPTATSGTLYMYEMVNRDIFKWLDCSFSVEEGKYKDFCSDSTSLATIKNATLVAIIKKQIEDDKLDAEPGIPKLTEAYPFRIDSVKITSFPASYEIKSKFTPKSDVNLQGEEPDLHTFIGYCFIDNLGVVRHSNFDSRGYAGITDISGLCGVLTTSDYKLSFTVENPSKKN